MGHVEWVCLAFLVVGIVLFNHAVDVLLVQVKTVSLKLEYIVCLSFGLFFSSASIMLILYRRKMVDLLSSLLIVFDVCSMPMFEYLGFSNIFWWVVLVLFPSMGIILLVRLVLLVRLERFKKWMK